MNQDNIRSVLLFCKVNTKYFEVSKVFEAIYTQLFYTSKLVNRLFNKANYQNDRRILHILVTKGLVAKGYSNYWSKFRDVKLQIDWNHFTDNDMYHTVKYVYPYDYRFQDSNQFIINFISHLQSIENEFKSMTDNTWTYKSYEIRYFKGWMYSGTFAFVDHKKGRYLFLRFTNNVVEINCNTFYNIITLLNCDQVHYQLLLLKNSHQCAQDILKCIEVSFRVILAN